MLINRIIPAVIHPSRLHLKNDSTSYFKGPKSKGSGAPDQPVHPYLGPYQFRLTGQPGPGWKVVNAHYSF